MDRTKEFVAEWEGKHPHEMSSWMRDAYGHTLDWLTENPHTAGFKEKIPRPDLDDASEYGTAKHFYWYFETHYFKAQKSFLDASLLTGDHHNAGWLDQPTVRILDIGCGTGAAICATLDLMVAYQQYRWEHRYPITRKLVHVIGVDPSRSAMNVCSRLLDELQPSFAEQHIEVIFRPILDEFPLDSCLDRIVSEWAADNLTALLTISSNVVRPLQNTWDKLKALVRLGGGTLNTELGDVRARAFEYLFERLHFTQVILIDIVTRNKTNTGERLFEILGTLIKAFLDLFRQKPTVEWWSYQNEASVTFLNSPNTFHADQGKTEPVTTEYMHSITIGANTPNADESYWREVRQEQNLKLAHARTRNYVYYSDFVDEIEIKLADWFWTDFGDRLATILESGDYGPLETRNSIYFASPKNREEDRPRYYLHLGEQLAGAAISQTRASAFRPYKDDCILGDRLNDLPTEFFYDHWMSHFSAYKKAIRRATNHDLTVAKVDIRSFYTRIRQPTLHQSLRTSLGVDKHSKVAAVLGEILNRDLVRPTHEPNTGLPQSGITAGLWASKYLRPVDQDVIAGLNRGKYFRYADDITLVDEAIEHDRNIGLLESELNKHGLELNPKKERRYTSAQYDQLPAVDRRFRELRKSLHNVLEALYFLPAEYRLAWTADRNHFLAQYSKLAAGLSIYFNAFWLNRKLKTRDSISHRFVHFISGQRLAFPSLSLDPGEWKQQFVSDNPGWIMRHGEAVAQLVDFFRDQYERYLAPASSEETKRAAKSAIRFTAYRLSLLGISPIKDDLIKILIEKPELLVAPIALRAMADAGHSDELMNLAYRWHAREIPQHDDGHTRGCGTYLSATACWALGHSGPSEEITRFLFSVLLAPEADITEQLMSSEALIRLQVASDGYVEELRRLMERCQQHPFLIKNLILLSASSDIPFSEILPTLPIRIDETIVRDAVQFALTDGRNILSIPEPSEIEQYYAQWYPDFPADLRRKHSSSGS